MARQRYDDKFRANAIVLLEAAGWPNQEGALTRTAKHLGVPLTTLRRWADGESNPPPADIVSEKRGELADLLRREIDGALGAMPHARDTASYRDLGTVVGIMVDKLQLITGEATERTEIADANAVRERIASRISGIAGRKAAGNDSAGLDATGSEGA